MVYFKEQHLSDWPLWFESVAGYLSLFPRLVAWIGDLGSAVHAPAIYAWSAVFASAAAITVFIRALGHAGIHTLTALLIFALTPTSGEVFGNLTNTQWFFQFYLIAIVFAARSGLPSAHPTISCLMIALAALSGPFSLMILLALAASEIASRLPGLRLPSAPTTPHRWWATPEFLTFTACATVQAMVIIKTSDSGSGSFMPGQVPALMHAMQIHTLGTQLLPDIVFAATTCALIGFAYAVSRSAPVRLIILLTASTCIIQFYTVILRLQSHTSDLDIMINGDRYFVLFKICFWLWLALAALAIPRLPKRLTDAGVPIMAGIVLVFPAYPHWGRPPQENLDWHRYATLIDAGEAVEAPILPRPWTLIIPGRPASASDPRDTDSAQPAPRENLPDSILPSGHE